MPDNYQNPTKASALPAILANAQPANPAPVPGPALDIDDNGEDEEGATCKKLPFRKNSWGTYIV